MPSAMRERRAGRGATDAARAEANAGKASGRLLMRSHCADNDESNVACPPPGPHAASLLRNANAPSRVGRLAFARHRALRALTSRAVLTRPLCTGALTHRRVSAAWR